MCSFPSAHSLADETMDTLMFLRSLFNSENDSNETLWIERVI